ncbi:helix-turn-helix transcriptional regulator [Rhodopila sp.]|uniref:helix-turn-helix transcriptional regulator n=1 Tax=Rhodopila sp. TaxID=2480087 RepID=UPI003D14102C
MSPNPQLRELADFIRVRRARLSPERCGFGAEPATRRRTPGLRREELGRLAGLSADWIAWLEQGRDIKLSVPAAARLALALRLDLIETEHLLALADRRRTACALPCLVPPSLRAIVAAQETNPAYVSDGYGDVLLWNAAAGLVFPDVGQVPSGDANLLRFMFLNPTARHNIVEWESHARRIVAQFRLRYDRAGGAGRFAELVHELRAGSKVFDALWTTHDVLRRTGGRKLIRHPRFGELVFDYGSFQVSEAPDLTLTLYVPARDHATTELALKSALTHDVRVGAQVLG